MTTVTTATTPAVPHIVVRPLVDADVVRADELAWHALNEVGEQFGFTMGERDERRIARARSRIRHIAATDPGGSLVAERDGELVGIALATRRESLWFLSLLAVRSGLQGTGIGRQLLDAALAYGSDCPTAMICASPDPKALRRYGRAGFALHAAYEAEGTVERSAIPADLGVREGDWERDAELVDSLVKARRGAAYGPDLTYFRDGGLRLLVREGNSSDDTAVAVVRDSVALLAGASERAAAAVLWAALAETPGKATVGYLTGQQQWAIEVALAARLGLKVIDTLCTRGMPGPPAPYLPSGLFG